MIDSIDLRNLRNPEYLQFQKDVVEIVQRNNPSALNVQAKQDALSTKVTQLDNLFMIALASENTQVLVGIDAQRDEAFNGISYVILGYTYSNDVAIKTAAQKLNANLSIYGGGVARLNYQAETATITNIINDWETKPELSSAIATLNLTSWKNYLKATNEQFSTIYINRTQEYGNASPETLRDKREETNNDYYALRDRINALHTIVETPPSPYITVINQLNALIEQYNTLLNNRATEPTTSEPETPVN
jgi:Family of unknown function (DUF6261)